MKHLTRMAFLFLTALLCLTAAYAAETTFPVTDGNLYFDKETGMVTGCESSVTKAEIPKQIEGVSVTAIGNGAFSSNSVLTSVTIPDSVTSIGNQAFEGCANLTSIDVENGNRYYSSLDGVLFNQKMTRILRYPIGKTATSYSVPQGVVYIDESAFSGCVNLKNVEIPDSVTAIENHAFQSCVRLTDMAIPDSVIFLGVQAFYNCEKLKSVKISNSVASIGASAFEYCVHLTSVEIPESVTSIEISAFAYCRSLINVNLPDSVSFIAGYVFYQCENLESVKLPKEIGTLQSSVFEGCKRLIISEIPANNSGMTVTIDRRAFADCDSLTSVKIPNSVIYEEAFIDCDNLKNLILPADIGHIGERAFYKCDSLRDVYYAGSQEQWDNISGIKSSFLISKNITVHYNSSGPDFLPAAPPLVNGHVIRAEDLSGLREITLPLIVSVSSPTKITVMVPFYDIDGRFVGIGFITQTVDRNTASVTASVAGDVSKAASVKVMVVGALRPASPSDSYPIM